MAIKRYEPLGENRFKPGDLVKRMIASHYTDHIKSDAIGVVLESTWPLAKVYFYDTAGEEVWNQKVLEKINK
tara:strand:- start:1863 stop:2078 length:216 start_codon:yes stop_codon:yes gene_type:complete